MTDLEKFNAWSKKHMSMDGYPQYTAFDAWIASRRETLEGIAAYLHGRQMYATAEAIRALSKGETE